MRRLRVKVREVAEEKGYNITTLAAAADLNYITIQRLWYEQVKRIDLETLEKVATALNISALDLLYEDKESE